MKIDWTKLELKTSCECSESRCYGPCPSCDVHMGSEGQYAHTATCTQAEDEQLMTMVIDDPQLVEAAMSNPLAVLHVTAGVIIAVG